MTDTLFKVAGFSTSPDGIKFHVSRDTNVKAININMVGETYFFFKHLPEPMLKPKAAAWLLENISEQARNTPAIVSVINKVVTGDAVALKAPKTPKTPVVAAQKVEKKTSAAETMKAAVAPDDEAKAKRLDMIRMVAAKRKG